MKNKKTLAVILIVVVLLIILGATYFILKNNSNHTYSSDIVVVPTLNDEITSNGAWCATFQLVWNDMVNEVIKTDIVFSPQITMAENLNQQSFTKDDISSECYYLKYGLMTLNLKEEIETAINEKFNQTSDILDLFNWSDCPQDDSGYIYEKKYFFYSMLYREFNFNKTFDVLDKQDFEGSTQTYEDIEYFGIDEDSYSSLYSQVDVLYYYSSNDFAVSLTTQEGTDVIFCCGGTGKTFGEIYNNILSTTDKYTGKKSFGENDNLKIPMIELDKLVQYSELENKVFYDSENTQCYISQTAQTIKLRIDESGGEIKSEAAIKTSGLTAALSSQEKPEEENRYFYVDQPFTMFLVETDKDLPYFAASIDDITLFQN